ncbi:hypothetical protein N657DRAFT_611021 [Parathielavia appendiculata]|uniref:F-box domain-containing protein n=1 Tax=Parathielavia appendiculata TaxID=2587402 RepID=A0AAN6U5S1_9PEZI|nr:hypothetical protein N657DRAFT_611021 [Parathielavia appendiculata]
MAHRIVELPDDILFIILARLDCTRDLRALALSCCRFHHLVENDGWRIFVRTKFPSLSIPSPASGIHAWQQLAESTTWQSRSWDKRSLQFQALLPRVEPRRNGRSQRENRSLFMSVVDAHFDPVSREELVVWGAGESIIARYRQRQGPGKVSKTAWHKLDGKELGLSVGYDDVKTVKIVKHGGERAFITGRHNRQLSLLSAEPDRFGSQITYFRPALDQSVDSYLPSEQETMNSLDILSSGNRTLIAAASNSSLRIYELPESDAAAVAPVTTYHLEDNTPGSNSARLGGARWMENGESIALALAGCKDPLRYVALTPAGWAHHAAAKSERVEKEFGIKYDRTICPNSLEAVHFHSGAKRGTSLLLSSWRDGTIRLQDLRTPSPFDAVYQDNVDPWSNAESLIAYGTERFVAGGSESFTIQIFDFRWPKPYHHTSGLPCLGRRPFPQPHQPFRRRLTPESRSRSQCDHIRNRRCHWHDLARSLYYRPNAKFFFSESIRSLSRSGSSSVWSLARGSDISPNFYMGISGGVIEATLEETPDTLPPDRATVDPNFGFDDWRAAGGGGGGADAAAASGYRARPLVPALMETGDGYSFKGNDRSILLPPLLRYQGPREWAGADEEVGGLRRHHRLDGGYQTEADFLDER